MNQKIRRWGATREYRVKRRRASREKNLRQLYDRASKAIYKLRTDFDARRTKQFEQHSYQLQTILDDLFAMA